MRRLMLAAAAVLALAACNQGSSGPALPTLQEGAVAPSTQTPQPGTPQATDLDAQREGLLQGLDQMLDGMQTQSGMAAAEGIADQIAELQPGTDSRAVVSLVAGTGYTFVGACDGDCSNLDIELISMETGGVVASDMLPDDFPVVNFTPPANGQYMVRMLMQTCTLAPCFAGTRALQVAAAATPTGATDGGNSGGGAPAAADGGAKP